MPPWMRVKVLSAYGLQALAGIIVTTRMNILITSSKKSWQLSAER
jgi:hypothetical protein